MVKYDDLALESPAGGVLVEISKVMVLKYDDLVLDFFNVSEIEGI
jgi:hypothetical protein